MYPIKVLWDPLDDDPAIRESPQPIRTRSDRHRKFSHPVDRPEKARCDEEYTVSFNSFIHSLWKTRSTKPVDP